MFKSIRFNSLFKSVSTNSPNTPIPALLINISIFSSLTWLYSSIQLVVVETSKGINLTLVLIPFLLFLNFLDYGY